MRFPNPGMTKLVNKKAKSDNYRHKRKLQPIKRGESVEIKST